MASVRTVLGCLEFGRACSLKQCREIVDICLKYGCHELDTALMYSGGKSEEFIGEIERLQDPKVIIATKANPWGGKGGQGNLPGTTKISGLQFDSVLEQLNTSLGNLKRKSVDIFYLHAPDHNTPIEETLKAVDKLHKEGKFREFGLSNYAAWQVAEIYYQCKMNNYVLPTVYQGLYNSVTRDVEKELFPCMRRLGIRFYAYNPLCGGLLTGKHSYDEINADPDKQPKGRFFKTGPWAKAYQERYWKKFLFEMVDKLNTTLDRIYGKGHVSTAEASFRWMYHHSKMDGKFGDAVILGVSSTNHLEENLKCTDKGPLHQDVINVFDEGWEQMKADCPSYLR